MKHTAIELKTVIDDNGEMEYNTVRQNADYYSQAKMDVLTFTEVMDDGSHVKNMMTIYSDKVSIKRTGPITMTQQFKQEQLTENVFKHPHGHLHMETYTNAISYEPLSETDNGHLKIDYTVKLNGQEERKHQLTLTIQDKEDPR